MRRYPWAGTHGRGSRLLLVAAGLAVPFLSAGAARAGMPGAGQPLTGLTEGVTENYHLPVGGGVQSVAAGQSFNARHNWNFNITNSGSSSLTGVQVQFTSGGSGADYTNSNLFGFNYTFFGSDPNLFTQNHACPTATATIETCPSPAVTLPPSSGEVTVFASTGEQTTVTPGFDSARSVTPIPSTSDSAVAVTVTLNDSRYQATPSGSSAIRVTDQTDNADAAYTPTIMANGQALPACPQPNGTACAFTSDFGAYQSTAGGSPATCESVSMFVGNAQVGIQYTFGWRDNEAATAGCPTGEPGVQVLGFTPGQDNGARPCDAGTDCSVTQSFPDLGNVTTSVDPRQGITSFHRNEDSIYSVEYAGEAAPPPPAATVSSAMGSSTTPTGTAAATNDGTTATGSGQGGLTVSQWGSDPVTSPPFNASGKYFDVQVLSGSTFSTVALKNCNLASGDSLDWWSGSAWLPVNPQTFDAGTGCVIATLSQTSSPMISQLGGTPFAVVNAPILALQRNTLKLTGTHVGLVLHCTHMVCRGTATLTGASRTLARKAYSIGAGKTASVALALSSAGRKALARVTRTRPFNAQLSVAVAHGRSVVANVRISR